MQKEIIVDDNFYPDLPLFEKGKSRDEQAKDIGKFAEEFKAYARHTDPDTSFEAATGIKEKLSRLENVVLKSIISSADKGMNSFELEKATGLANETCTPRLAPLRRKGFIMDSGMRRPGKTGRNQIVWISNKFKEGF